MCPECKKEFSSEPDERSMLDKGQRRQIMELAVKCVRAEDLGCDWTGELFGLKEHLNKNCPIKGIPYIAM